MHYILGTKILISSKPSRPRPGERPARRVTSTDFKPDLVYELYHIVKDKEGKMRYVFISSDHQDVVGLIFDTIGEADIAISQLRQESLPDYEGFHSKNNS
jgi:hypothetical protein